MNTDAGAGMTFARQAPASAFASLWYPSPSVVELRFFFNGGRSARPAWRFNRFLYRSPIEASLQGKLNWPVQRAG